MNHITITTPENIEIEYRLAGAGSRLAAVMIDMAVQTLLFILLIGFLVFVHWGYSVQELLNLDFGSYAVALIIIAYFAIYFGYFIICEIIMRGQSIGKKIFGLRVIRDNGRPVALTQSLIRNIFRNVIDIFGIGILFIMFNKNYKRIGDMAASTLVISENMRRFDHDSLTADQLVTSIDANINIGNDHIQLTTDEYYLLKEYFVRKDSLSDCGADIRKKITLYMTRRFDLPAETINDSMLTEIMNANLR